MEAHVFISHDSRDAKLAEAFSNLLSNVSIGLLKSFYSSAKIEEKGGQWGGDWYQEIFEQMEIASDVVCLITERSIDSKWLNHEAGIARGKNSASLYCILFGLPMESIKDGPFQRMRNCENSVESITDLVSKLVKRIPGTAPNPQSVEEQVLKFKKEVGLFLNKSGKMEKEAEKKQDPEEQQFCEPEVGIRRCYLRKDRNSHLPPLTSSKGRIQLVGGSLCKLAVDIRELSKEQCPRIDIVLPDPKIESLISEWMKVIPDSPQDYCDDVIYTLGKLKSSFHKLPIDLRLSSQIPLVTMTIIDEELIAVEYSSYKFDINDRLMIEVEPSSYLGRKYLKSYEFLFEDARKIPPNETAYDEVISDWQKYKKYIS